MLYISKKVYFPQINLLLRKPEIEWGRSEFEYGVKNYYRTENLIKIFRGWQKFTFIETKIKLGIIQDVGLVHGHDLNYGLAKRALVIVKILNLK